MVSNIILDFDETISDTSGAIARYYNELYKYKAGFVPASANKIFKWDFSDQCPLMTPEERGYLWGTDLFFNNLEPMPNVDEFIGQFGQIFNIHIVTLGTEENLVKKAKWIRDNINNRKFIKDFIGITRYGDEVGKSIINMSDSIFIDDHTQNLISSNADYRYIFGRKTGWNNDADNLGYIRLHNWKHAQEYIIENHVNLSRP